MAFWFTFFLWAASFVLADYFRPRLPAVEPSGQGDFKFPTSTQGRKIPIILGGTVKLESPNTLWYGDWQAQEVTVETGVVFKRDETVGYSYSVAIALGQFFGESAGMTGIYIGDDKVWDYVADNAGVPGTVADVNLPDFFGGERQGGGFVGRFRAFTGANNQPQSAFLADASRVGPLQSGWPGLTWVMLTSLDETSGATIGESNSLRDIRIEWQVFDTIANGGLGDELTLNNDHHFIGRDANPINTAYKIWTDQEFGIGAGIGDMDLANFQAVAETIFTEGLGYSEVVDQDTDPYEKLSQIEKHVDGYIGPNPLTGKIQIKLARSGYDPLLEFQADASNIISIRNYSKPEWPQVKNEVKVQYVDRNKEYNDTYAIAQDMAGRLITGRPQSITIRFPGIREAAVANRIVSRSARGYFWPLAKFQMEMDRTAYNLRPGDVIIVNDADIGAVDLPTRVTRISQGDPVTQSIKIDVVEDIFADEPGLLGAPPDSDFTPPVQSVSPFNVNEQWAIEAPYIINRQDTDFANISPRVVTAGARQGGGSMTEYEVIRRTGNPPAGAYSSADFVPWSGGMVVGTLRNNENGLDSTVNGGYTMQIDPVSGSLDVLIGPRSPGTGNMEGVCVIDPGGPNEEWVVCEDIVDDLTGIRLESLWRGAMDTGIKEHTAGERIWFIWTGGFGSLPIQETPGTDVGVKLLPRSSSDAITEPEATEIIVDMPAVKRYNRPLLPAFVNFNGIRWPSGDVDFDTVIDTEPQNGTLDDQGVKIAPRLRDWRNQDVLDQVQGGGIRGDIWGDDGHEIQYWVYNLQTHPSPSRGDAIFNTTTTAVFATNGITDVLKSVVETQFTDAETNSLPFRIEIETSHVPGFGQPRITSKEVLFFDFTAIGTFVIPFGAVFVHLDFENAAAGDFRVFDRSANNHLIRPTNNDIGVSTSVSPPFGSNAYRVDRQNPATAPVNSSGYLRVPSTGDVTGDLDLNNDWTLQTRIRFSNILTGNQAICGQWGTGGYGWQLLWSPNRLQLQFSTDTDSTAEVLITFAADSFAPLIDEWNAIAITRKQNLDTTITFSCFVNGTLVDQITVSDFTINLLTGDLGIGASDIDRTLISGATGSGLQGYLDEFRLIQGAALFLVDYTLEVNPFPYELNEYVILQSRFEAEAGTAPKLADDLASGPLTWSYEGGAYITGLQSRFGRTCLRVDGAVNTASGFSWGFFEPQSEIIHQRLGINDFTIEGWVRFDTLPSTTTNGMALCGSGDNGGNARNWWFGFDENDALEFAFWPTGTTGSYGNEVQIASVAQTLAVDTWYWLTICRNGNAIEAWLDGTRIINDATFFNNGGAPYDLDQRSNVEITVGKAFRDEVGDLHRSIDGFVDDFRITKRGARYTGASITVPTEALPIPLTQQGAAWDAAFLPRQSDIHYHCHFNIEDANGDPYFENVESILEFEGVDAATSTTDLADSGRTWTFSGTAQLDTAQSSVGSSSLLLDGNSDYIDCGDDADFEFPASGTDFSIEMDVRFATLDGASLYTLISKAEATGPRWDFRFDDSANNLEFFISTNGANSNTATWSWNPVIDTWYNVVLQRIDGRMYVWIDGAFLGEQATFTIAASANTAPVVIGARNIGGTAIQFLDGWVDHFRYTLNAARHGETDMSNAFGNIDPVDFAFALKSAPDLWMQDHSDNGFTVQHTNGSPFLDRAQKKFGSSALRLKSADTDYVTLADNGPSLSSNAFIIEAQVRFATDPGTGNMTIASEWNTQFNARGWILAVRNNQLVFEWDDSFTQFSTSGAFNPAVDTWYHLMVCKVQGVTRLFVDGTQVGSDYEHDNTDRDISNPNNPRTNLGTHFVTNTPTDLFDGWIDEFRILTPGSATAQYPERYFPTEDFTAPVSEYDFHRCVGLYRNTPECYHLGYLYDMSSESEGVTQAFNQTNAYSNAYAASKAYSENLDKEHGFGFSQPTDFYASSSWITGKTMSAEQHLRSLDFTFEAHILFDQTDPNSETMGFFCWYDDSGNQRSFFCRYNSTNDNVEVAWYDGTTLLGTRTFAWADPALDTWYHIALVRNGDALDFYLDGTALTPSGDALPANFSFFTSVEPFGFGVVDTDFDGGNPQDNFEGKMQDPRVTVGKAVYTSSFTPPANPFLLFGSLVE